MSRILQRAADQKIELEIIACSLHDAMEAYRGGASRLEVTVRLDQSGLTPPVELVKEIIQKVPIPIRIMLRDRPDFYTGDGSGRKSLKEKAAMFAALNSVTEEGRRIDGLVTGHIIDGRLDLAALKEILGAAPNLNVTAHHAIEATRDPLETLRALRDFPGVDRALVSGGSGSLKERTERLLQLGEALGPGKSLIAGGNLTMDMLKPLRDSTGISIYHLGRAVRTPEETSGFVDRAKIRKAADLLELK